MEYVGFEVIKDKETSLKKWDKNKVRESGILVSNDEYSVVNRSDNVLVIDNNYMTRTDNYLFTSLKMLVKCEDRPSYIIVSEDRRVLERASKILSNCTQYSVDYVDLGRDDDLGFLLNRVKFTEPSVVLIHASDSKIENKKIIHIVDSFINKTFVDNKNKGLKNKVYMFIDCVTLLPKSQLLVKSISLRKPDNLRYIFIVDDLDCFNYDYQREASTIKDSCNSILYYSSKDKGTLNELSRISLFERVVVKPTDEKVVFDYSKLEDGTVAYIQRNGISRITKIKE